MAEVDRTATGATGTREDWYRARHATATAALLTRGVDPSRAWWCALALVAHWARETGHGRSEWNWNVGNIRAGRSWRGDTQRLQGSDDASPAPYRSYANAEEGVDDTVRLVVAGDLYKRAFTGLLESFPRGPFVLTYRGGSSVELPCDASGWYAALMRAGWHPYSDAALNEYAGVMVRVARAVGAPPVVPGLLFSGVIAAALWGLAQVLRRRLDAA